MRGRIRHNDGFTLVELLVVIGIIALLAGLLLPAALAVRGRARTVACMQNLRQLGVGLRMYVNDFDGVFPCARWKDDRPNTRWPTAIGPYIGGSVEDPTWQSTPQTGNRIINDLLRCPAIGDSDHQLPDADRADYLRTGSYGYNWMTFGPFWPDPDVLRPFPTGEGRISVPQNTIMVADAFGDASMTDGVHAYTLDPPVMLNGRWGSGTGGQCPADPRHTNGTFAALFADGHAATLTMREAGYDAEVPQEVGGTGDPSLWNGRYDPSLVSF